ncbi:MAG: flagellar hook-associated protein FlgK [Eubacterium sp.]|nr:flagellar hook-associated protein FlgK [Eubacterium sp.]
MASNGFGSFWVGTSGLQTAQASMNITANNLANLDTTGYVRRQVLQSDKAYSVINTGQATALSQVGTGVTVADVVHTRDLFLDKYYRTESGRQNFYDKLYEATTEVETIFQELEGSEFLTTLTSFYEAMSELAKDPSDSVNQNLVVQKASLLISRAQGVYESLEEYQENLNTQVEDMVETINSLGEQLAELNLQIAKVEAGGTETAYDLRDERDNILDELAGYGNIEYKELLDSTVTVKFEGTVFVDGKNVDELATYRDAQGYSIPYWTDLSNFSDKSNPSYYTVYDMDNLSYDTEKNTDIGELKALLVARGTDATDYSDILNVSDYASTTTANCLLTDVMARLDNLIHTIVTEVNNIFSPLTDKQYVDSSLVTATARTDSLGNNLYDDDGNQLYDYTYNSGIDGDSTISVAYDEETGEYYYRTWDEENADLGSTLEGPGEELFSRFATDRYTTATINGETVYVYNEEDQYDTTTMYTTEDLVVNSALLADATLLPYQYSSGSGDVDMTMAANLEAIWSDTFDYGGDSTQEYGIMSYYQNIIDVIANKGTVYESQSSTLEATTESIDNQRQQIIAVSSDEELSNMIRFQNAYNAASRYINVINEMTEIIAGLI